MIGEALPSKECVLQALINSGLARIATNIQTRWANDEHLDDYFLSLLIDGRAEERCGFSEETYLAILKLYTIYCLENHKIEKWANTFFVD